MEMLVELVITLHRHINVACVQETEWVTATAREIDGYKVLYSGITRATNGVGILVDKELANEVVEVRHKSGHILTTKLVVG